MRQKWNLNLLLALCVISVGVLGCRSFSDDGDNFTVNNRQVDDKDFRKDENMLAHNVYFTLKDNSQVSINSLMEDCRKYLREHPGIVFFAAGELAADLDRPVNVRDFDVSLHIVFENQDYQDKYQAAESHLKFVEMNKDNWDKVRVFDSSVD